MLPEREMWAVLTALAAGAATWRATALVAALLTVWKAMDLFAERHLRRVAGPGRRRWQSGQ